MLNIIRELDHLPHHHLMPSQFCLMRCGSGISSSGHQKDIGSGSNSVMRFDRDIQTTEMLKPKTTSTITAAFYNRQLQYFTPATVWDTPYVEFLDLGTRFSLQQTFKASSNDFPVIQL